MLADVKRELSAAAGVLGEDGVAQRATFIDPDNEIQFAMVTAGSIGRNVNEVLRVPAQQLWGTALACAVAARNAVVLREIAAEAATALKPEAVTAAKAAASIMAMNNVYYRAKHLIGSEGTAGYAKMPARLRMQVIGSPGVDKVDFELWCLAVSAVTGCGGCLESHEKALRAAGLSREAIRLTPNSHSRGRRRARHAKG